MNANELFYVAFLPVITIINFCIFGAFYFLVENEPKAGVIKKIEDFILFLPKKLFFIEGVTFKFLLGIGFIVLCFILIIKFFNCDTIIEKLAPCNPTDSAQYLYNVVNTISGILTPLFSLLTVIVAFVTLYRQRKQNAIQNFENHLFQMIEQQHKLEEKVVNKHDSFMDLYENFCDIYRDVWKFVKDNSRIIDERNIKEISLKISNYIFYFGADQDLICDKTYKRLIEQYGLEEEKLKSLINELNNKLYEKYMGKKLKKEKNDRYCILFCTQKSEELGIYYRNLFNAIRYIDWECPDGDKKEFYAKLVRTNLSDFAQLMLYYNMQGERGSAWLDKDEVKDPKGDQDGYYYSKNKKDGKPVRVKDCLLTRYLPIKNCAISVKNKDIDPRKDGRTDLFSDDVIHYELKY